MAKTDSRPQDRRPPKSDLELDRYELRIMKRVALWYNGAWFDVGPWYYNIGYKKPPSMRVLLGCRHREWEDQYEPALERLQADDYLEADYILRRKCQWAPTEEGRRLLAYLYAGDIRSFTPLAQRDAGDDVEADLLPGASELAGDWNESLLHRTGVEIAHTVLQLRGWEECQRYPGELLDTIPDVTAQKIETDGGSTRLYRIGVEVLTDHNANSVLERKYERFADSAIQSCWLFENRAHAFRALNYLHNSDEVYCDLVNAPYHKPENYPISVGNEYVQRSSNSTDHWCRGIDEIGTITGWFHTVG